MLNGISVFLVRSQQLMTTKVIYEVVQECYGLVSGTPSVHNSCCACDEKIKTKSMVLVNQ